MVIDAWSELGGAGGLCEEPEGKWASVMVQLRNELLAGDERVLYLMWLSRVWAGEVGAKEEEGAGGGGWVGGTDGGTDGAGGVFADWRELMDAARGGREKGVRVDEKAWKTWVKGLPGAEKERVICEAGMGGSVAGIVELRRRLQREVRAGSGEGLKRRRAGELIKM